LTPADPSKKVTLSGSVNVIDGADADGRLLIMTTNCPDKLDPALLRAGRCDEKFKLDYTSKATARMTFTRIFGIDFARQYKMEPIDRMADAFAFYFPSRSKIYTAELSKYFGQYRGHPDKAVEESAECSRSVTTSLFIELKTCHPLLPMATTSLRRSTQVFSR
jgi:chaperone BCS1